MFGKKTVEEIRFLTKDEQGRVELWMAKPDFIQVPDGESFFEDLEEPENQITLDSPINNSLAKAFWIDKNTCVKIKIKVAKDEILAMPIKYYNYSRKNDKCVVLC